MNKARKTGAFVRLCDEKTPFVRFFIFFCFDDEEKNRQKTEEERRPLAALANWPRRVVA
jgi:hypothetical protein